MKVKMKILDVLIHPFDSRDRNCPSEASVLAYSENTLSGSTRLRVERHFAGCDECRELLAFLGSEAGETTAPLSQEEVTEQTNRVLGYIRNDELSRNKSAQKARASGRSNVPFPRLATAGLTICALLVAAVFVLTRGESQAAAGMEAIRAAVKPERRTEARISGGFAQSPFIGTRGDGDEANTDNLQFDRALGKLRSVDEANAPLDVTLVLARAHVARGTREDVEHGLRILTGLADRGLDTREVLNDTGVAYVRQEKYNDAIDCFRKALAKSPGYDEALFNIALAEQRDRRVEDARRDWQRFIDQSSDENWKAEAAGHLRDLSTVR